MWERVRHTLAISGPVNCHTCKDSSPGYSSMCVSMHTPWSFHTRTAGVPHEVQERALPVANHGHDLLQRRRRDEEGGNNAVVVHGRHRHQRRRIVRQHGAGLTNTRTRRGSRWDHSTASHTQTREQVLPIHTTASRRTWWRGRRSSACPCRQCSLPVTCTRQGQEQPQRGLESVQATTA